MYSGYELSIKRDSSTLITMAFSKPDTGVKRKRFDMEITDERVDSKHIELQNRNTKKAEKTAQRQFMEYLSEIGCSSTEFWTFDETDLDRHLAKFWFAARQEKPDKITGEPKKYKVQSLKGLRYGLKRFLIEKGHTFDIISDGKFRKSQIAFDDACKELKSEGLGYIQPFREISPTGTYFSQILVDK